MSLAAAAEVQSSTKSNASEPLYFPRVTPLDGELGPVRLLRTLMHNPLRVLPAACFEQPIVVARRNRRDLCWVTGSEQVKTVLLDRKTFDRTDIAHRMLGDLLGNGLLSTDWDGWAWQHQTLAPIFRPKNLTPLVPMMNEAAQRQIDAWCRAPRDVEHVIGKDMARVAFEIISRAFLPGGYQHVHPVLKKGKTDDFEDTRAWQMVIALLRLPTWLPYPGKKALFKDMQNLRDAAAKYVSERRHSKDTKDDLLQRLVDAKHPETGETMPDALVIDNVLTFFLGGHQTTAETLTWKLFLLARAPEWQTRIFEEVRSVVGDGPVLPEHVEKLTTTEQVFRESMRLFPPTPILTMQATKATDICGTPLPKDTHVILPIYAIHRHRKIWEDPDRFDPTRFTPERMAKHDRYQYLPFGAGPRVCIGAGFSMLEAVTVLANFVRAVTFTSRPNFAPESVSRITLRPLGGMPLKVTPRPARASA